MAKQVNINVGAKDHTKAAFNSVLHNLANLAHVGRAAIDIFKNFSKALTAGIKTAMGWESAARPFARFVGSVEEAQGHVKALQEIGARGVVNGDELVEASRSLMQLSGGLVGGVADMKALADVSATTGEGVGKVADSVGNFLQRLKAGDDVTRAVRDLESMGVISGEAAATMRELATDSANAGEVFDMLQAEINKFSGGVEDDMTTAAATVDRVKDQWRLALGEAGEAFLDTGKTAIGGLADKLQDLRDSGVIEQWAQAVVDVINNYVKPAFDVIVGAVQSVIEGIRKAIDFVGAFKQARKEGLGVMAAAGFAGAQSRQVADARREEKERQQAIRAERIKAARDARAEEEGAGFGADGEQRAAIEAAAIEAARKKAEESAAKEAEKLEKELQKQREKNIKAWGKAKSDEIKKTAKEEQRALQDAAREAEGRAQSLAQTAEQLRAEALDPKLRRQRQNEERGQQREERKFQQLIEKAQRGISSPQIKAAVESMRAADAAKSEMENAEALRAKAEEAAIKSEEHLAEIASKIQKTLEVG